MWVINRIMVWLCSVVLASLQVLGLPDDGCISGHHWAVCWEFPRYGYTMAVAALADTWSVSGCVPGAERHVTYYTSPQWTCAVDEPPGP